MSGGCCQGKRRWQFCSSIYVLYSFLFVQRIIYAHISPCIFRLSTHRFKQLSASTCGFTCPTVLTKEDEDLRQQALRITTHGTVWYRTVGPSGYSSTFQSYILLADTQESTTCLEPVQPVPGGSSAHPFHCSHPLITSSALRFSRHSTNCKRSRYIAFLSTAHCAIHVQKIPSYLA